MLGEGLNEVLGGDILNGGSNRVDKRKVLLKEEKNVNKKECLNLLP
jgi:hypothetical protein